MNSELYLTPNGVGLDSLGQSIHENAKEKGFHFSEDDYTYFARESLNLIGEISELQEASRDEKWDEMCDKSPKMIALGLAPLTCLEEEYADIVIRALDQMQRLIVSHPIRGIGRRSISNIVMTKHIYNKSRQPLHGRRH